MKIKITMVLTMLIISYPQFSRASEEWSDIQMDKSVIIIAPDYADIMGPKGIFNVCATDNELRSIEPVSVCEQYKVVQLQSDSTEFGENVDFNCEKKGEEQIRIGRNSENQVCEKSIRLENEDQNSTCLKSKLLGKLPIELTLEVAKAYGEDKGTRIFTKNYRIPKC